MSIPDPVPPVAARHGVSAADVRYYRQFYSTTHEAAEAAARSRQQFGPTASWQDSRPALLHPVRLLALGLIFAALSTAILLASWHL